MLRREKEDSKSNNHRTLMKFVCLASLTFQNAAYVQLFKYSRLDLQENLFITSTAVCMAEVLKLFFSFFLMVTFDNSPEEIYSFFYNSIIKRPLDTLNMCVPAATYVVMTNLMYVSQSNLDVITYQIVNQMKIPATVFLSMIFLRSRFRKLQYLSVLILMVGATIVQVSDIEERPVRVRTKDATWRMFLSNKTVGIVTGLVASILSGFSGVYFERILKSTNASVWARNVQLSVLSIPPALLTSFTKDWSMIEKHGFFHGYTGIVWLVIFLQAFGGLIVALSVKLADNVSKGYATSASIIVSGISSTIIFHYKLDYIFACGAALVVLSIPLYTCSFKWDSKIEPVKIDVEGQECYI